MATEESPLKWEQTKITSHSIASLFPLNVYTMFPCQSLYPQGALFHKSISSLNPSVRLAFSFSFLLMQIPWLIELSFFYLQETKENNGKVCIHWQSKNKAARKSLNGAKTKGHSPSHLAVCTACSFIFHSHVCPYKWFLIHFWSCCLFVAKPTCHVQA